MRGLLLAGLLLGASAGWAETVSRGNGAVLRVLDKLTGDLQDVELADGDAAPMGRLQVELAECRYPEGNPAGDAYAYLVIRDTANPEPPAFSGWMVASSPALNALDHSRYDVWVLRCTTS